MFIIIIFSIFIIISSSSNSERMLSLGSPGDTGISAAIRRRTLPLGKFWEWLRSRRSYHCFVLFMIIIIIVIIMSSSIVIIIIIEKK